MTTLIIVAIVLIVLNELTSFSIRPQIRRFYDSIPPGLVLLRVAVTIAVYAVIVGAAIQNF